MNLKSSQLEVDTWIKEHGVRYFNELTNMAQLTEEEGEVARIIARRYGEQSEKESDKNKDLGEELADVVFVVLCLANQTGIDLQAAFDKKMDVKSIRDKATLSGFGTLKGLAVLSPEAKAVLAEGKKLWQAYFAHTDVRPVRDELKLNRPDVGWYQVRNALKKRNESGDFPPVTFKPFEEAYKVLTEKLQPKVYEYGFLKE